ncbi:FAD-dependent oxidoreductase [Roseateles sp.]|uniref:protoporphyrinogen/coproporphyrinogen oxidase n=1 Tax=Roseateles sp. TaxID=1971397 RepID=UPI0032641246
MNIIIGAGLAGLSCSYHLGHEGWLVLEQGASAFGHASSLRQSGFTWDQGPHVSFTKHEYVRELFVQAVGGEFEEFPVCVSNYFQGTWINHPAQTALFQVPEPLRTECLQSFLHSRSLAGEPDPINYAQWLDAAFGSTFAKTFPAAYTRKYWTVEPAALSTDWLGGRVLKPDVDAVLAGSKGPMPHSTHYINTVRYPRRGGYQSFAKSMAKDARIRFGSRVVRVDLDQRSVWLADGECMKYQALINTIPLPDFINACINVPLNVRDAARALSCTQLLMVNVGVHGVSPRPEHWIYVYDEDKISTRLSFTDKLAKNNAPGPGWTGVQAEVYFSRYKPLLTDPSSIGARVHEELVEMGVLPSETLAQVVSGQGNITTSIAPWANVIFLHDTKAALDEIWQWLAKYGLVREQDDTHPLTDWTRGNAVERNRSAASLSMAGRFGQWKYFWSDDCVMRGRQLANSLQK